MSSAWGLSFGKAWGDAWGMLAKPYADLSQVERIHVRTVLELVLSRTDVDHVITYSVERYCAVIVAFEAITVGDEAARTALFEALPEPSAVEPLSRPAASFSALTPTSTRRLDDPIAVSVAGPEIITTH